MSAFQQYQAEFAGHIRDPKSAPRPQGVKARRIRVYTEIVFNNMEATLAACFPVTKKTLGVRRWVRLVRAFLAEHRCTTPWFRQIPEEFLRWLETSSQAIVGLPSFLYSLAHYEWVELAVAVADVPAVMHDPAGDLLQGRPVLAPSLALLEYAYPVHRISSRFRPLQPSADPIRLLVFRDAADEVRFSEINVVTARLLQLLQQGNGPGYAVLEQIAREMERPDLAAVLDFGRKLLHDLRQQGAILGVSV